MRNSNTEWRNSRRTVPKPDQSVVCQVPETNSGAVTADEIVQPYISDWVAGVTRPVRELKRLRRASVEPGDTAMVEFTLTAEDLAIFNNGGKQLLEPGLIEIFLVETH